MDPNDCIYPVAFSIVEMEDTANWRWFLQTVKKDLGIHNTSVWTIMSDKQKGLIKAVSEISPESEHRFYVRHLWQNFNQLFRGEVLKNQLWKIARTTTIQRWEEAMEEMKLLNKEAYDWLKCDILLNNNCEVFNKYILEARELPVLTMIDRINQQLMTRENSVPAGQNRQNYTFYDRNAGNPTLENVEDTILEEMVNQVPPPNTRIVHPMPLPDSTFISAEQSQNVASGGSSSGVEHNIAAKKSAEAKQLKSELAQQRRLHVQQKKEQAADLRKLAAAQKKEALLAARQQKAAQKEAEKARKVAAKQQQAAERRAPKPTTSQPNKVSMFDEFRS
ncbi:hypothetical protein ACQ4PT_060185 [Festuca glaucescens]